MKKALALVALTMVPCLDSQAAVPPQILRHCVECHNRETAESGLDLTALAFDLKERAIRERWIRIHDRVEKREMPPKADELPKESRAALVKSLAAALHDAEHADILKSGRGPMRRLNRDEYEQNLRDILKLPHLDIRDMLPADREAHHFDKVSETLDMSRVQLAAYLDAAESALRQAMVTSDKPPTVTHYRAVGKQLSQIRSSTGGRQSLFYVRDWAGIDLEETRNAPAKSTDADPTIELALFRSPGWPYAIYPRESAVTVAGEYRVRFAARAVLQTEGFKLKPGNQAVPLTFRSRRPTNHDIAEDVRSTGGIIDIQPEGGSYETTVLLGAGQTVEYGLLGLPVPQVDAEGKTGQYRYPPFPVEGQPGVAFQWLEIDGPIAPETWPPPSHRVLFDNLGFDAIINSRSLTRASNVPANQEPGASEFRLESSGRLSESEAKRLLRRFMNFAAREPVPEDAAVGFERLVQSRLRRGVPFTEALLAGYKAFLCSDLFLYLREPKHASDHFAIADRLSHFLSNTRPDETLAQLAVQKKLRDAGVLRHETDRLIASPGFERFVNHFTDSWLGLRELRRDDPDIRLYPEYRLDDFLVESMGLETRAFFTAMIRENLPATTLVDADFTFANARLARHYGLPPVTGSTPRKVALDKDSPYGGLLTQAAILKVSANGSTTSPVLRGAWIMDRLIGQPAPPPPPGVSAVEPDIRGAKTIRELLAQHTQSKECAACHAKFDPVGLALENFDVMGAWRTRYRGSEEGERVTGIDRSGHDFSYTIATAVDASGALVDGRGFKDIHELKAIFAADPRQLARNLLHQFTLYSTGTPVRFGDRREIETMLDACAADGYRVGDLVHALVQSQVFSGKTASP